jgi:hypothetical protein
VKTIVSVQEIEELEVKPPAEVAAWREMVVQELRRLTADGKAWVTSRCPCCDQSDAGEGFTRYDIPYVECTECHTLYARRRFGETALASWYRDSTPARFWRERLLRASDDARREKIVGPRAQWVVDGMAEYSPGAARLVDVSTHGRPLIEEILNLAPSLDVIAAGQTADLDGHREANVTVRPTTVARLGELGPTDTIVAIDILDRTPDVRGFVQSLRRALRSGGVVFATVPVSSGFEVQTLWERSSTVLPPDKVNLPSIDGLLRLFGAPDWEVLELSTPGMFDVEIVKRAVEQSPNAEWPRVVRALVGNADAAARAALTEYLQSQRLTSFARLVARKVG